MILSFDYRLLPSNTIIYAIFFFTRPKTPLLFSHFLALNQYPYNFSKNPTFQTTYYTYKTRSTRYVPRGSTHRAKTNSPFPPAFFSPRVLYSNEITAQKGARQGNFAWCSVQLFDRALYRLTTGASNYLEEALLRARVLLKARSPLGWALKLITSWRSKLKGKSVFLRRNWGWKMLYRLIFLIFLVSTLSEVNNVPCNVQFISILPVHGKPISYYT